MTVAQCGSGAATACVWQQLPYSHTALLPYISPMITHLKIAGMSCQHCVNAVFTALTPVPGITSAQVAIGSAAIEHDGRATEPLLREAIESAGYELIETSEQRRTLPVI